LAVLAGCTDFEELPPDDGVSPPPTLDPLIPSPGELPAIPSPGFPIPGQNPGWADNGLSVTELSYVFTNNGAELLQASGVFPQTGVAGIDRFYETCREDFETLCAAYAEDAAEDFRVPYRCNADFTVECNAGGLFSVARFVYTETGGAHGSTQVLCDTFQVATGKRLALEDFFTAEREQFTERLVAYIVERIAEDPERYYENAAQEALSCFPYDQFCVTTDGVSIVYGEYTLAPYSAGLSRFDIPWSVFEDLWTMP